MEYLIALLIAVLFGCGVYMIMGRRLLTTVFGFSFLSNACVLFIITMGRLQRGEAPIVREGVELYADPLPQAMVVTAIILNLAIVAYALVLAFQTYRAYGTEEINKIDYNEEDENE